MELKVNEYQLPQPITFNFEELKAELIAKTQHYETVIYTDDQIKSAKADRANLNRLKKALNDERISREKEYLQPFNEFKAQVTEIIGIIDKSVKNIDDQVKASEEKAKEKKAKEIHDYFITREFPDDFKIPFEKIFNDKWLNASVKMPAVKAEIDAKLEQIAKDLVTLADLPDFSFEATEEYKRSLDVNKAISEGIRLSEMQRRKAERQAALEAAAKNLSNSALKAAKSVAEYVNTYEATSKKQWVGFTALLSPDDAKALKAFFESRNIEFKPIKSED